DGRGQQRFADPRPQLTRDRRQYVFYPGLQGVPENLAPKLLNRPFTITADVELPTGGDAGVLVCHGSNQGRYVLYVKDRRLHYVHNYVGVRSFVVSSKEEIPEGRVELRLEFETTGKAAPLEGKGAPGRAELYVNR